MSTTHHTKAIILRTTVYGETSLIVSALTEKFGIQQYIVKGVRKATKAQAAKAIYFQPAAILEMTVYANPLKQLNFVKDYKWAFVYKEVMQHVAKNAVALFCVELMQKCMKQPDDNPDYYNLLENVLLQLDKESNTVIANLPIYYSYELMHLLGLLIMDNYNEQCTILDLLNGTFINTIPEHQYYADAAISKLLFDCLQNDSVAHLAELKLNGATRKKIIEALELFFQLHISEFGKLKSLDVMSTVLS